MLKQNIETFIEKITRIDTDNDLRDAADATGWYFPGHLPGQRGEAIPDIIPGGGSSYLDSDEDEMVQLIEEGITETDRGLATASQGLASVALNDTVQSPSPSEA